MKLRRVTTAMLAIAMAPTIALSEGKYRGEDFQANSVTSRKIQDGTIEAKNIAEKAISMESPKLDLGDSMSYVNIPLTHIASGTVATPIFSDVFVDANVTIKARCFVTNTTLLPTLDIYPEAFTDGSTQRGEDSVTSLTSATAVTSKQLFNVAAATGLASGPKMDGERTPIFFVALNGTVYYLALTAVVNLPNQSSKCSYNGFIVKINPEA
jgi:hypothetical protein